MKIYNPDNFIKDQILPSEYKGQEIYAKINEQYVKIDNKDLYINDNGDYLLIGKLNGSYNAVWFASDMEFLNRKLEKSYRQMNIWDFYRIVDTVNEVSEFAAKQDSLIELTGLIINCGNFIFNNEAYATGDIVYRTADGVFHHISAERGGMFYPSKLVKDGNNNNFTFTYSFINTAPTEGETTISPEDNEWDASSAWYNQTINFTGISSNEPTSLYSIVENVSSGTQSFSFEAKTVNNNIVQPIIKIYIAVSPNNYEEVYCPFEMTYSSGNFTISFDDTLNKIVVIK